MARKNKREREDYCNICGEHSKLTWDHVPPKCCNNNQSIIYQNLVQPSLSQDAQTVYKYLISQNGLAFRSLCESCNNANLGQYDVEYGRIYDIIDKYLNSNQKYRAIEFDCHINKLARAIIGHLLASKNFYDEEFAIDIELRKYFFDQSMSRPDFKLLYYYYPYKGIVIARDISILNPRSFFHHSIVSCLFAYPLAFILYSGEGNGVCEFQDLFKCTTSTIDQVVKIKVDFLSCYLPDGRFRHPLGLLNLSIDGNGSYAFVAGQSIDDAIIAKLKG
ncbi:MAG: hypothetical protein AAGU77_05520 [Bacillota bacterium]